MREDVLILLNEREQLKQQMAAALSEQLEARGITNYRLKPTQNLVEIVTERSPRLLILDFLLGDEGTALDLMSHLSAQKSDSETASILWTDERSVGVAVSAMKLGAEDYIELGGAKDIEKVIRAIELVLARERPTLKPKERSRISTSVLEPIAQTASSRESLIEARRILSKRPSVITLFGPAGSGRSHLARYLHSLRSHSGEFLELGLETWSENFDELFGRYGRLSCGATVLVEHAELDANGELLNLFIAQNQASASINNGNAQPLLIVGSADRSTMDAWSRFAKAEVVEIPGLENRKDDFLPLIQRFLAEAKQLGPTRKIEVSSELVQQLAGWQWDANIRQLRTCVLDVALAAPEVFGETEEKLATLEYFLRSFEYVRELDSRSRRRSTSIPAPLVARAALERAGGNMRIAASTLGVELQEIRKALQTAIVR